MDNYEIMKAVVSNLERNFDVKSQVLKSEKSNTMPNLRECYELERSRMILKLISEVSDRYQN